MAALATVDLEAYLPRFGLSSFRPGQREVIETVLAGRDSLCVMPTGGGKSLCYQLPALAQRGVTLVVSPLIALMKDQVDQLRARDLPATFINSTLSSAEQSERLRQIAAGQFQLVYVVPERFRSRMFLEAVRRVELSLLAIDEAHCVSEWGHDFRPDYARLGDFREQLGNPTTIALTATATDQVRQDVCKLLKLREPEIFIKGFARENLFYGVQVCPTDREKDQALAAFLAETPGSGIVYVSTRKRAEDVAARISQRTGRGTVAYHAGLAPDDRRAAQDAFMQSRREIAVATLAFGMGIDKADVRFVVHYNLPRSLEAYYQEAGRAGRDGLPANCLLLAGGGDRQIHEFFIESAYPAKDVVRQVYHFLSGRKEDPIELTRQEIKEMLSLPISEEGVGACEKLLEKANAIERLEMAENAAAVRLNSEVPTLVELLPQAAKVKRQVMRAVEEMVGPRRREWCYFPPRDLLRALPEFDSVSLGKYLRELSELDSFDYLPPFRGRAIRMLKRGTPFGDLKLDFDTLASQKAAEYVRLDAVIRFAAECRCRQQVIVQYFGETDAEGCGHCDNCHAASGQSSERPPQSMTPAILDAMRKVLSGVARVSQRRSSIGKQLLSQMLCGAENKAIAKLRLDKLSTFGILSQLKKQDVVQLVDALLLAGLLEQTEVEPFRPVVQLTAAGTEAMHGRALPEFLPISDELSRALHGESSPAAAADPDLLGRLKTWRAGVSRAKNVKPYMVMSNAALEELARARPQTAAELLTVKGIGEKKAEEFGSELLEIIHVRPEPIPPRPPEQRVAETSDNLELVEPKQVSIPSEITEATGDQPAHYWTWRLLSAGFSPAECAAIRGIDEDVVLDHALRAADAGMTIDAGWFLTNDLIARIDAACGPGVPPRIRPLLEKLPRGTRYEDVQLVLKSRQFSASSE